MTYVLDPHVNVTIPSQFPQVYNEKGPNFIAFMKAYYEWLEQTGNPLWYSRNFSNIIDIDNTLDQFIIHFKNEYMANIPGNIAANQRLLIKHITDLYLSKGSKRGFELLFRILFNEDIDFYLPSQAIFKLSDNEWSNLQYLEVTDSNYLNELIGTMITSSTGATAIVEDYNKVLVNNKVINVLSLSNVDGEFIYGEPIISPTVNGLTTNNAPIVLGSLQSVSIYNGGIFFKEGDIVNIKGNQSVGVGRVASVTSESGKIVFNIVNGGYGFTMNPQIIVSGGNGTGATFSVGGLSNVQTIIVDTDVFGYYYNTQLESNTAGFTLDLTGVSGTFQVGEVVNAYSNGVSLDFFYSVPANHLLATETLSNTVLGISGLQIVFLDNPSFVVVTGTETALNNANLVAGAVLVGGTSGNKIHVNSVLPKTQYHSNATVTAITGANVTVNFANGYFLPTSVLHGQTSGASGTISATIRNTSWGFPVSGNTNLDTAINNTLTYENLNIGTITRLTMEDPGQNYISNATVSIIEPLVSQLQINDGVGGFWGDDALITATSLYANGIITSLQVLDSGYGFVHDETVVISANGPYIASGSAVVDGLGKSIGSFKNNNSLLSDDQYLQDSYYYQLFSYEIVAERMIDTYEQFVNDLVHPIGYKMFGRFRVKDDQNAVANLTVDSITQYDANGTVIVSES